MSESYTSWINSDFRICPVCKKKFYIPPYVTVWTYKIKKGGKKLSVCSYSCMNKATDRNTLKGEHYLNTEGKWQKKSQKKRSGAV